MLFETALDKDASLESLLEIQQVFFLGGGGGAEELGCGIHEKF